MHQQYLLRDGQFFFAMKASKGIVESTVVKGFKIDIRAVFEEDANLEELKRICR